MRIIAGKHRGRLFDIPKSCDVRPTTDRVRESMFSSIISLIGDLSGLCVLDAYAGSGALGFEAVSRGASSLYAFERDKLVYKNLVKNSEIVKDDETNLKFNLGDIETVKCLITSAPFDILFFDPPYKNPPKNVVNILNNLKNCECLAENALVVYEHSKNDSFDFHVDLFSQSGFELKKSKVFGDIAVEFLV